MKHLFTSNITCRSTSLSAAHRRDVAAAEKFVDDMRTRLDAVRHALLRAQAAAERADAIKPAGQEFQAGDYVFLRQDALSGSPPAGKFGAQWHLEPLRTCVARSARGATRTG